MHKKILIPALIAIFLSSGSPAFAQEHEHGNERGNDNGRGQNSQDHRDQGDRGHGYDGDNQRGNARNDRGNYQVQNHDEHHDNRGAGPRHDMRRGGRLPPEYRSRQYEVNDWRDHHLSQPPRGYHWVQTGGDYVLVAVATGIIMQILLNQ